MVKWTEFYIWSNQIWSFWKVPTPLNINYAFMNKSGEGNGTPLQYFYLENLMDRGAW